MMSSATDNSVKEFYSNDIVYKFDDKKNIVFGVVSESYEASDTDEFSALQKGQLIVVWNNSSRKQIIKQSRVHLVSRSVIPGDIVRRLQEGVETQRGYCKSTKQTATVQIVESDKIIENVPNNRLCFVKPFEVGDAVCLGEKFGRIQSIDQMIRMQSKCGSVVEVRSSINYSIRDHWYHSVNSAFYGPAYPGQTVYCTPMHLKDPKWIKKSKAMKRKMDMDQTFRIQNIDVCLIEVWWYSTNGNTEYGELKEDEIKKLKVIPYSEHLLIYDRQLLQIKSSDVLTKKKDWTARKTAMYLPIEKQQVPSDVNTDGQEVKPETEVDVNGLDDDWCTDDEDDDAEDDDKTVQSSLHSFSHNHKKSTTGTSKNNNSRRKKKNRSSLKLNKYSPGTVVPVEVLLTDSKSTIVWQDGTEEKDIPTTELYYSVSLDEHELFPGECVVPISNETGEKYGVVQKVNFAERTAEVKWFEYSQSDKKPLELSTNEVSVYDLKKHPKFIFRPGSVVKAKPTEADKMGKVIDSCPEGYVVVKWLNWVKENCWPQNIELIPESEEFDYPDDFSNTSTEDDEISLDAYSWQTESVQSFEGDANATAAPPPGNNATGGGGVAVATTASDDVNLQNMASKVDFVRSRISYLREAFRQHNINDNFHFVKDLLCVYDNSSYLDKYLGTSYFSLESKHFQALLVEAKKKAKSAGIELKGRLFSKENLSSLIKLKSAEKENIQRMIKLESKMNAQIECTKEGNNSVCESCPTTPESLEAGDDAQDNLCIELLIMLKMRLDLAYAEIISRIGGRQALTVLTDAAENNISKPSSMSQQHFPPMPTSPDELLLNINLTPSATKIAISAATPEDPTLLQKNEAFCIIDEAPDTHRYYPNKFEPKDLQKFLNTLQKEYKLLKESLPQGVWVRCYDNRIDLLSVMIRGPAKTPYEDGLFLFDIQLSMDYPHNPPFVHFISFSNEQLNPNLYVEGKVCVSLLGTWMGRGSEVWTSSSTLLQLIVSIQGLILVAEPYYNEAGYERQTHTQQGYENSRTYNEYVLLKLVQSMTELLTVPPKIFRKEILQHFHENGERMCERLMKFCDDNVEPLVRPEFPLLPVSKGLKLSLRGALNGFSEALKRSTSVADVATGQGNNDADDTKAIKGANANDDGGVVKTAGQK